MGKKDLIAGLAFIALLLVAGALAIDWLIAEWRAWRARRKERRERGNRP